MVATIICGRFSKIFWCGIGVVLSRVIWNVPQW